MDKIIKNRYKINKELGRGGMAIVYEATDIMLDRQVALKMVRPEYASDDAFIEKIKHEARAVARISHPNVVNIYDIGQVEKAHYLVMENINGQNLKDIIEARGKLPVIEALDIASQIAAALHVAHDNSIVHCDIKPHNIIVTPENQVKVTDFGIARAVSSTMTLNTTNSIVGSAHYFSPEQAKGGEITPSTDIYSLGIVLYEMLTGKVPYTGETAVAVALQHIKADLPDPNKFNSSIPVEVIDIIEKALAKDSRERYSNALELREELLKAMAKVNKSKKKIDKGGLDKTKIHSSSKDYKESKITQAETKNGPDSSTSNRTKKRKPKKDKTKMRFNIPRSLLYIILSLGIIVLLTGTVYFAYNQLMNVPIVEVPDLTGLSPEEAEQVLDDSNLDYHIAEETVPDAEIPEGNIASQTPSAGDTIRETREIRLILSSGPETGEIPELSGLTLREASLRLENLGYEIGEIEYDFSSEYREDHVIRSIPDSGEELSLSEEVSLVVSQGNILNEQLNGEDGDSSGGQSRQRTIRFTASGNDRAEYRIMVEDSLGHKLAWRDTLEPGERVEVDIESYGTTTYLIYRGEELIYEQQID
ncbi:MAG: Stk1 family PASTA domain-containing Ser/Thr kinase [Bacillota bacterium]